MAVQMLTAHFKLTDGFRHVATKPADLAGHPVARDCASPITGPASRKELLAAVQKLHAAKQSAAAVNDS